MNTREMQLRLWSIFVFFILSVGLGVASVNHPVLLSATLVCISFMTFNGFMLMFKILLQSTKLLSEQKRKK